MVLNNKGQSFQGQLLGLRFQLEIPEAGFSSCEVPRLLAEIVSPQCQEKTKPEEQAPHHLKSKPISFEKLILGFNSCQKDGMIPISIRTLKKSQSKMFI